MPGMPPQGAPQGAPPPDGQGGPGEILTQLDTALEGLAQSQGIPPEAADKLKEASENFKEALAILGGGAPEALEAPEEAEAPKGPPPGGRSQFVG